MRLSKVNVDATGMDIEIKKGFEMAGEDLAEIDAKATVARDAAVGLTDLVSSTRLGVVVVGVIALLALGAGLLAALRSGATNSVVAVLDEKMASVATKDDLKNIEIKMDLSGLASAEDMRAVKSGVAEINGKVSGIATDVGEVKTTVGKVVSGQQELAKQTKRLVWRVRQVEASVKASTHPAPAVDRSVTYVAKDGTRHTVKIREH